MHNQEQTKKVCVSVCHKILHLKIFVVLFLQASSDFVAGFRNTKLQDPPGTLLNLEKKLAERDCMAGG